MKKIDKKTVTKIASLVVGVLVSSTLFAAQPNELPTINHPKVKELIAVQESITDEMMATDGIIGTAVGQDHQGKLSLIVFVNSQHERMVEIVGRIPRTIKNIPVKVDVTEPFLTMIKAVPAGANTSGGIVSHKAKQSLPIQLGTSGSWGYDLANGYCCGGTLGSLVTDGTNKFILSNYHVLEADIVSGGNNRITLTNDPVTQPGLIDASCNISNTQTVASTSGIKTLPNSNVDASIALAPSSMVKDDGSILEVGTISSLTVSASLNQAVKKSGRTTGLTKSSVYALNASVSVAYENECAGGAAFTKTFTGQIMIKNSRSTFLNAGDSGSLMLEDKTLKPKAIGLLFAGSSTLAIANPINDVLKTLSVTMVGTQ